MAEKKGVAIDTEGGGKIYASEIIEQMKEFDTLEERFRADGKSSAIDLIAQTRKLFVEIYDAVTYCESIDEARKEIENMTDTGMRYLEMLDKVVSDERFGGGETVTQCVEDTTEWKYIKDGVLPKRGEDILFSLKCGQVFEGYMETTDHGSAFLTEDGKIAFKEHEDGGKFFRYRFRDFLDMRSVVAWAYKPAAAKYERKENAK